MAGVFNAIQSTTDFKTKKVKKETEKNLLIFTCGIQAKSKEFPIKRTNKLENFKIGISV